MNIEKDLKKDGITVIRPVDTLTVTLIAKFVAEKLLSSFPFYGFNYDKLFIKIVNTPMYIADIPDTMGEANYFYKNAAIYFRDGLSVPDMKKYAVHEFVHAYQAVKDKKNVLYKLGLCDFTGFKIKGMALNEAAVQLIASKALRSEYDSVKYYDIEFNTNTPNCYPIICNLVRQMGYVIGENVLFDSTFNSNSKFSKAFSALCGEKNYIKLQDNLDKILQLEEKVGIVAYKIQYDQLSEKTLNSYSLKTSRYKEEIRKLFFESQELIISSYFDKAFDNLHSMQDIEDFRHKLYSYKDLIGETENYSYFNDYYINMMYRLDEKYESIYSVQMSLIPYKRSIAQILFDKIHATLKSNVYELQETKIDE